MQMKYKIINAIVDSNNKLKSINDKEQEIYIKNQIKYLNEILNRYLGSD